MHVLLVILGGIVLLSVFMLFGWLWGASTAGISLAAKVFVPVWLIVAVTNMWVGVHHAGYSVREEFPILLLVLAVPVAIAFIGIWWLGRT